MDQNQALAESRKKHPGSRSLRCIWHCGVINGRIRASAKLGETSVQIDFPPKHYVTLHRDLFLKLYAGQGYRVSFEPDFQYIQPTKWTFTIRWDQPEEKPDGQL